jgi:hypothetical protein
MWKMDKSTSELLQMLKNSKEYLNYHNEHQDEMIQEYMPIGRAIKCLIDERNLKKSQVIAKSGIEVHYAYQILSGAKIPSRDKVIMFCIGMDLLLEECQQLLKITGYSQLYAKHERDNVLIFGICKKLSLISINDLLYDLGLDLLS